MTPVLKEIKWAKTEEKDINKVTGEVIVRILEMPKTSTPLKLESGKYHATAYTKNERGYYSICIITEKPCDCVILKGFFNYERELVASREEKNLWYALPVKKWEQKYGKSRVELPQFGLNQCGHFQAKAYKDGICTESCDIQVHPYWLTDEEYAQMENEIIAISERLMSPLTQIANGGEYKDALLNASSIKAKTEELADVMDLISRAPQETLRVESVKTAYESIRKFDYRALIEHTANPFGKVNGKIKTVSFDTREHRMIKKALSDLIAAYENHRRMEESLVNSTGKEHERVYNLRQSYAASENKHAFLSSEYKQDKQNFDKRLEHLSIQKSEIINRMNTWDIAIKQLEKLTNLPFLGNCQEEAWDSTHVFRFHPLYRQLHDLIESIKKELHQTSDLLSFQQDLIRAPQLYEKWVYFKALYFLVDRLKFRSNNETVTTRVMNYYDKQKTLEGLELELFNANMKIVVCNESSYDNGKIKPDFTYKFSKNGKESAVAFLDAKFKPYSEMKKTFDVDIEHSAVRYKDSNYAESFEHSIAFLAHPDAKKGGQLYYGGYSHRIGCILLKPGADSENLIALSQYFSIILHYFLQWEICPVCGLSTANGGVKKRDMYKYYEKEKRHELLKTHYSCDCSMFWVRNKCWLRKSVLYPHGSFEHLYKYADWKIHYEDKETEGWDVHCPVCCKSYKDMPKHEP